MAQSELGWALTQTYVSLSRRAGQCRNILRFACWSPVTLSEELNFTRAAKRLGITQSGLSRRVGSLEKKHRIKLFERDHANVVLTEAGRVFVEEAKLSLMHDERAIEVARAVSEGVESVLTIGRSRTPTPS